MATPLINALRVQGGTFYTFSSAANDISKTFSSDDTRFVFSKFVLLDLPDVATPSSNYENYIVWEALGTRAGNTTLPNSSVPAIDLSSDNNINFAQSFQNYVLNFEQLILDGSNTTNKPYDSTQKHTVCERLFWKWLTSINAIRFRTANTAEAAVSARFTEENEGTYYNRVVKYIGDIDIINNVSKNGQTYSEVYLNVPVSHGNTPLVLFKTYQDANYSPARIWQNGNLFVDGRDSSSVHPTGLSLTAYWDNDVADTYNTQTNFTTVSNFTGTASVDTSPKPVLLSRLDGIMLDMDAASYTPIVKDPAISLISEYNASNDSGDFSFNAALIYYDLYDASNPLNKARNLYGILVLDDYENQLSNSYIKRYDKYKHNKITKLNGNGYGLKLNLKFDTSADNVGIETIINDYNTFSMDLFIDASTRMQEAAELFLSQKVEFADIKSRLVELENYFFTQDNLILLNSRISQLEQNVNNAMLSYASSTTLLDLINKNADNINNLLNGKLTSKLSYNTEIIKPGLGIIIDKSIPNQVTITNRVQAINNFMLCKNDSRYLRTNLGNGGTITATTNNNILVLGNYTNYFKQKNQNSNINTGIETFEDNLVINIDDSNVKWSRGQVLRIVFDDKINLSGLGIIIKTDVKNVYGLGVYGKTVAYIKQAQLISNRPIIEIYCEDEKLYTFGVDILR